MITKWIYNKILAKEKKNEIDKMGKKYLRNRAAERKKSTGMQRKSNSPILLLIRVMRNKYLLFSSLLFVLDLRFLLLLLLLFFSLLFILCRAMVVCVCVLVCLLRYVLVH